VRLPLEGALIAESLRIGAVLDDLDLTVRKISRSDVGDVNAGQPLTWTFIHFEAPAEQAPRLAVALSNALDPTLGWYCDFRTTDETFVVFGGRVFRYPRGDRTRRSEAESYARSVGVPESQIDWPE
jgi:hypothetical protein